MFSAAPMNMVWQTRYSQSISRISEASDPYTSDYRVEEAISRENNVLITTMPAVAKAAPGSTR